MPLKTMMIGHSLVGTTMPQMLNRLLAPTGRAADTQVINGSPLGFNWDNGATAQGVNARALLPTGRYDTLILTEGVPLDMALQWNDTYRHARNYADLIWNATSGARVMIYETWRYWGPDIYNGSLPRLTPTQWRQTIDTDRRSWQSIADSLNDVRPAHAAEVVLVPGGQAMGRLYDTISAGHGAGFASIKDVFIDNIHLNDTGNWLISLVQFSAITGRSAVGQALRVSDQWGQTYGGWSDAQSILLQHVAWEAVALTPGMGLAAGQVRPTLRMGGNGHDTLTTGSGDDRLYGGSGNDRLNGGAGQDLMSGGNGRDRLDGGNGHDWIYGDGGNDTLNGGNGGDRLMGGSGNDSLSGGNGNDILSGDAGRDYLAGNSGADRLYGHANPDTLAGGAGNDTLVGGAGGDRFIFQRGGGADRITDFSVAQGDKLALARNLWSDSKTPASVISAEARVTDAGVVIGFDDGGSVLLQGLRSTAGLAATIELI
ncbi:calcium-binding protein [Gemmobacter serpentinus]|uniref:calcium-binding protein n=1 Tax=Gemmobacter serpentinus TaxID=2652247 RepID=UPI001CF67743|nr:calcium-binding protein [Gemmobacter serpentinus]